MLTSPLKLKVANENLSWVWKKDLGISQVDKHFNEAALHVDPAN